MRIGEFSDSFLPIIDGVGRVVKAYTDTLALQGHEVYVIAPMADIGFRGKYPFEIIDYNSRKLSRKMPWRVGIESLDPHFSARMKMVHLDICHTHAPFITGHAALNYSKKNHIPLIGSFHSKYYDDILKSTHSKLLAKFGTKLIVSFYNQCDEVWAVSDSTAETLKSYGFKGKIITMPNGTNKQEIHKERLKEVISKYKLNTEIPILLFVGQINFKKNLKKILEACALLKKQDVKFQLVFAGIGPDDNAVQTLATSLDLKDNFIMTGHLQDIQILNCLYYISTLFVFPSIYDNAPMVLREAAAMHTVSLAVEGSCTAEVIKNMENGLLCKDTSEDLCEKIKLFLSLPEEERKRLEDNAYNTIPVPWDSIMDNVVYRYENLINKYKKCMA